MLRLSILASGSSGNCIYVGSEQTGILVDAGLSCRQIAQRLEAIGVPVDGIQAVCVTHEHDDHKSALGILQRRLGVSLYANAGTIEAIERDSKLRGLQWNVFTTSSPFTIGDLALDPFPVPHDSYDPVGFVVTNGTARVGIVTDMGMATTVVRARLRDCGALVIEANHDEALLRDSPRPWSLKQRIAGRQGHLSNQQAADLLAEIRGPALRHVFLAHLSTECNRPDLALKRIRTILDGEHGVQVQVEIAAANRPTACVDIL
jgi:phosphoribosyl 1,2-cyclic phosphodiesterase